MSNILWLIEDLKTVFISNIKAYFNAKKDRGFIVCLFRGFKTEKERQEYLTAFHRMEKRLSFPIINKKESR